MALAFMDDFIRMMAQLRGQNPDIAETNATMAGVSTPYREEDQAIQEDLDRIRNRETEFTPDFGTRMRAIGSTFRSLGSGGRVPNQNAEIMAEGERAAREQYKMMVQKEQEEQALRYIAKTGNPELLAAFRAGMDPSQIIKLKFDQEQAQQNRAWEVEDMGTQHKNRLAEIERTQQLQAEYDPTARREAEARRINQEWFTNTGLDGGGGTASEIPQPIGGVTTPPPEQVPADVGPVPAFSPQQPTEPEVPTVDEITQNVREYSKIYDMSPSDAHSLYQAAQQGGREGYLKELSDVKRRMLDQAQMDEPQGFGPNQTILGKDNKVMLTTPPAPVEEPSSVREARIAINEPVVGKMMKQLKMSESGQMLPEDKLYYHAAETVVDKVFPEIIERGQAIANSESQMQALEYVFENTKTGLNPDSLISNTLKGWSGKTDTVKSIIFNLAPKENKVPGIGAQSDVEYAGALAQWPSIIGTPEGNKAIISIIKAKRAVERDRAAALADFYQKKATFAETQAKIEKINQRSILEGVPKAVKDLVLSEAPKVGEESAPNSELDEALKEYPD